ncbi:MAG: DNA internalization-related competence protein ComEC/Rec2 [Bacteroidota bacterium]
MRLTARPALIAAVALGFGIVVSSLAPLAIWMAVAGASLTALVGYAVFSRGRLVTLRPLGATLAALVTFAALGGARMVAWTDLPADHLAHAARHAAEVDSLDGDPSLVLWGTVDVPPTAGRSGVRFVLRADSARKDTVGQRVRGLVQITLAVPRAAPWDDTPPPLPVYPALRLGDRVAVAGRFLPARGRRNPADFDYRQFLAHRGIHATLRAEGSGAIAFLAPAEAPLDRLAGALRHRVERALGAHVPSLEARAVLAALLIADRSQIDPETRDQFVAAGLVHLLAVSGLHVLLVGFVLYGLMGPLLGRLGVPRRTAEWSRSLFTLGLLAIYVLVTGAAVPVTRAFVMASVALIGRALEKPVDTLNTLGFAALVLLMIRPSALFEVGFQLSFSAVAALATLTPLGMLAMRRLVPERVLSRGGVKWSTEMTLASAAATLGTAPVLLVHFGRIPLAGLVLNLAAIPLTGISLGTGLLTVCLAPLPFLADRLGALADVAARLLLITSEAGATGIGWIAVERFVTDPLVILALIASLAATALWLRPRARWRLATLSLALVVLAGWKDVAERDAAPRLDVAFLDVGQGDATVLRFPNGSAMLIDAGVRTASWDNGRTVLEHLARHGIRRLDAIVATHADADHVGGLPTVLGGTEVGRLVHSGETREDGVWAETQHLADSLGIAQQTVAAGDSLLLDPTVRIRILAPGPKALVAGDSNERSVALLVQYGETEFLLTGDAEAASEAEMVARYVPLLRADVATVGHHGSRTSSTSNFVRAASRDGETQWAVVSVARRNAYGLPNEEPLQRWTEAGATVLSTATEGAVWLRSDGRDVHRVTWR